MRFVDHHLAHAISAYAYSGFDDAAVVVMDGRGAWEATSIWHGRRRHARARADDSVGRIRWAFSTANSRSISAFSRNSDEWKVMGLAPTASREWISRIHRSAKPRLTEFTPDRLVGNGATPFAE